MDESAANLVDECLAVAMHDQQSWRGARDHRDARTRELARDSARYRVCLEAAALFGS
jgi:hypothetical protein